MDIYIFLRKLGAVTVDGNRVVTNMTNIQGYTSGVAMQSYRCLSPPKQRKYSGAVSVYAYVCVSLHAPSCVTNDVKALTQR